MTIDIEVRIADGLVTASIPGARSETVDNMMLIGPTRKIWWLGRSAPDGMRPGRKVTRPASMRSCRSVIASWMPTSRRRC